MRRHNRDNTPTKPKKHTWENQTHVSPTTHRCQRRTTTEEERRPTTRSRGDNGEERCQRRMTVADEIQRRQRPAKRTGGDKGRRQNWRRDNNHGIREGQGTSFGGGRMLWWCGERNLDAPPSPMSTSKIKVWIWREKAEPESLFRLERGWRKILETESVKLYKLKCFCVNLRDYKASIIVFHFCNES